MDHSKTLSRSQHGVGGSDEVQAVVSFHLDVDAGEKNSEKYISQAGLLTALDAMPLVPSLINLSDGDDCGFHAYWLLEQPYYITDESDRQRCKEMASRWLEELRICVRAIDEDATVDGTANLDRLLRPIGSKRKSGNVVKAFKWEPEQRYALENFTLPALPKAVCKIGKQPDYFQVGPKSDGNGVISRYLDAVGITTVESVLFPHGYQRCRTDRYLLRPGSSSGAPTGEIYTVSDGRTGFTVKSGAADPLSNINPKGNNGRWYSVPALWVAMEHNNDWEAAEQSAKDYFDRPKRPRAHKPRYGPCRRL